MHKYTGMWMCTSETYHSDWRLAHVSQEVVLSPCHYENSASKRELSVLCYQGNQVERHTCSLLFLEAFIFNSSTSFWIWLISLLSDSNWSDNILNMMKSCSGRIAQVLFTNKGNNTAKPNNARVDELLTWLGTSGVVHVVHEESSPAGEHCRDHDPV